MKVMSEERAKYLADEPVDSVERTETRYKDPIKQVGYASMEHVLTFDNDLSDGAFRTYAHLKYHWQQKELSWQSVATMARARGISEPTIKRHLAELSENGLIKRERRDGHSSFTWLLDLPQKYVEAARIIIDTRVDQKRYVGSIKSDTYKKNKEEEQRISPYDAKTASLSPEEEQTPFPKEERIRVPANVPPDPAIAAYKARIAAASSGYDGRHEGVADPVKDVKAFKREYAPVLAEIVGHEKTTSSDRWAAGKLFELKLPLDWLNEKLRSLRDNGAGKKYREKQVEARFVVSDLENEYARRNGESQAAARDAANKQKLLER